MEHDDCDPHTRRDDLNTRKIIQDPPIEQHHEQAFVTQQEEVREGVDIHHYRTVEKKHQRDIAGKQSEESEVENE